MANDPLMNVPWKWIVASDYNGQVAAIVMPLAREYQLRDFMERFGGSSTLMVNHYERPPGHHWDGSSLSQDEIATLKRRPYSK